MAGTIFLKCPLCLLMLLINVALHALAICVMVVAYGLLHNADELLLNWIQWTESVSEHHDTVQDLFVMHDKEKLGMTGQLKELSMVIKPVAGGLMAVGALLCVTTMIGVAALHRLDRWPWLMKLYVLLMLCMAGGFSLCGHLYIYSDSAVVESAKNEARDILYDNFKHNNTSEFDAAINGLQFMGQCCGVTGPDDYGEKIPISCCKSQYLTASNDTADRIMCRDGTAPKDYYIQLGCVDQVIEALRSSAGVLASFTILLILMYGQSAMGVALLWITSKHK